MPDYNKVRVAEKTKSEEVIFKTTFFDHDIHSSPTEEFMVGESAAMKSIFNMIRRQAPTSAPILITGESGTGKELVARAIHQRSSFQSGRFVAINCASLPPSLIASELFGYEKGAFTGANNRKIGLVELANKGTIFLDEIGDLPLDLQGHLLRFLQEGTIIRVGGHQVIQVCARVISATHVDLRRAVMEGKFREDLYYRLNVLPLHLPALRDRDGDILLLANFFLHKFAVELGRNIVGFSERTKIFMETYPWPGNIREMISAIRRAVVMGQDEFISVSDLSLEPINMEFYQKDKISDPSFSKKNFLPGSKEEKYYLKDAILNSKSNLSLAARHMGISRVTLYRMMKRNKISREGVLDEKV